MNVRPLNDRLLVQRIEAETTSKGGIIIPDTAKEKPIQGRVVAVGQGKRLDSGELRPLAVKAGDKVLFSKYAGNELKLEGEEFVILREDDCLGIVQD